MTPGDALNPQPGTSKNAESADRVGRILGTARLEAAARAQVGAYQFLVGLDEQDGSSSRDTSQLGKDPFQTRPRSDPAPDASKIHDTRVVNGTVGTVCPAITTKS